jgi:hypothetical protein
VEQVTMPLTDLMRSSPDWISAVAVDKPATVKIPIVGRIARIDKYDNRLI